MTFVNLKPQFNLGETKTGNYTAVTQSERGFGFAHEWPKRHHTLLSLVTLRCWGTSVTGKSLKEIQVLLT